MAWSPDLAGQLELEVDPSLPLDNLDGSIVCRDALFTNGPTFRRSWEPRRFWVGSRYVASSGQNTFNNFRCGTPASTDAPTSARIGFDARTTTYVRVAAPASLQPTRSARGTQGSPTPRSRSPLASRTTPNARSIVLSDNFTSPRGACS